MHPEMVKTPFYAAFFYLLYFAKELLGEILSWVQPKILADLSSQLNKFPKDGDLQRKFENFD